MLQKEAKNLSGFFVHPPRPPAPRLTCSRRHCQRHWAFGRVSSDPLPGRSQGWSPLRLLASLLWRNQWSARAQFSCLGNPVPAGTCRKGCSHVGLVLIDDPFVYYTLPRHRSRGRDRTRASTVQRRWDLAELHILCFLGPFPLPDSGRNEGKPRLASEATVGWSWSLTRVLQSSQIKVTAEIHTHRQRIRQSQGSPGFLEIIAIYMIGYLI